MFFSNNGPQERNMGDEEAFMNFKKEAYVMLILSLIPFVVGLIVALLGPRFFPLIK